MEFVRDCRGGTDTTDGVRVFLFKIDIDHHCSQLKLISCHPEHSPTLGAGTSLLGTLQERKLTPGMMVSSHSSQTLTPLGRGEVANHLAHYMHDQTFTCDAGA